MIRLLLCDLDGTLVEAWRTTLLPDVRERLLARRDQGVPVVVVTNQGGIGYRYAFEQRGEWARAAQYPTFEDVQARLAAIAAALPLSRGHVSLYHGCPDWPIPDDQRIEIACVILVAALAARYPNTWRRYVLSFSSRLLSLLAGGFLLIVGNSNGLPPHAAALSRNSRRCNAARARRRYPRVPGLPPGWCSRAGTRPWAWLGCSWANGLLTVVRRPGSGSEESRDRTPASRHSSARLLL